MNSNHWVKRLFWWSGVYGVLALVPNYFLETRYGLDHPPAITHPEFYYGFAGLGLAWQIAFFIIAKDPVRYRAIMIPSMFEKVSFSLAIAVLWMQSRVPGLIAAAAVIDFVLAVLFAMAFVQIGKSRSV